jgi:hypothetical protein
MDSRSVTRVEDRYDHGALQAAVLVMTVWHLVPVLLNSVLMWRFDRIPVTYGSATWLGYAVIGAITAWIALRGGGRGPALPLAVVPLLLFGMVVTALSNPEGSFYDPYNWPFDAVGWFALVALWRRPVAELLLFFAVNTIIGFTLLVALGELNQVSLALYVMYAYGVSILQITLFIGGHELAAIARRTAEAHDRLARGMTRRLAAEAVLRSRRRRYETVQRTVSRLLAEIAADRLELTQPAASRRIRVAVTRLRRLTVETDEVPDPLLHELRACADEAEKRGIGVDLQAPVGSIPALPVEVRRALADPIIEVLAVTTTRARLTVVAPPSSLVVAIMADASIDGLPPSTHDTVQISYDAEGDLLWVQARWNDPSPLPSSKTTMSSSRASDPGWRPMPSGERPLSA